MIYTLHTLLIHSEMELPELNLASGAAAACQPDVNVRLDQLPKRGLASGTYFSRNLCADGASVWVRVPKIARFQISAGKEIVIDPDPNADPELVRACFLAAGMGILLFQRGILILHGNAININGRVLVCLGPSGIGKSTLATAFMQQGYGLLSDDVVAIDQRFNVLPSVPRIKVWPDTAQKMGLETSRLRLLPASVLKYGYSQEGAFSNQALPLAAIYVLNKSPSADVQITPLLGMQKFQALYRNSHRMRYLEASDFQKKHFNRCTDMAAKIPMARVDRPEQGFEVDFLMKNILQHFININFT